uniref:Uncharacterized protein n=1 Tax=Anguilla anguilla TaxID=7936 RepID=A0A0E9USU3_ANGAN
MLAAENWRTCLL